MNVTPTVSFSFVPTCRSLSCCCCGSSNDSESHMYPTAKGKFKFVGEMTDLDIEKANERFKEIILRKLDPLPLNNDEFLDRLENEEGISLTVDRQHPLTKERLDRTVNAINKVLRKMQI